MGRKSIPILLKATSPEGETKMSLPSNMALKIKTGTVGYNNKVLVSDGEFILGKMKRLIL